MGIRDLCGELMTVMRKPWYMWAALAMCGLMAVLGLINLVSTFFADTVIGASHSRITLLSSSFPAGILTCMIFPAHFYARRDHDGRQRLCVTLQWISLAGVLVLALAFSGEAHTTGAVLGKVTDIPTGCLCQQSFLFVMSFHRVADACLFCFATRVLFGMCFKNLL